MDQTAVALFVALAFVSWTVIVSIRRVMIVRLNATVQSRVLDKLPSAESLVAYSQTEHGRSFLHSLLEERASSTSPYRSILSGVQAAILLSVFGLALLFLHRIHVLYDDGPVVFGVISLALGIGFALAASTTYLLSSRFGLFEARELNGKAGTSSSFLS